MQSDSRLGGTGGSNTISPYPTWQMQLPSQSPTLTHNSIRSPPSTHPGPFRCPPIITSVTPLLQNAKALGLSDPDAVQRYVMGLGVNTATGKHQRSSLSAIPITTGGKNRKPEDDMILRAGDLVRLDRCPGEYFILLDLTAFMSTTAHRCVHNEKLGWLSCGVTDLSSQHFVW
jgi:hypothetical protein